MKQNIYPVSQSSEPQELFYLNWAIREFVKNSFNETWYDTNKNRVLRQNPAKTDLHDKIITWLYISCRSFIPWHYDIFKKMILEGFSPNGEVKTYSYDSPIPDWNDKWLRRWKRRHTKRTKYTRKSHHVKKVVDETLQSNCDWREHKAFNKDRLKSRHSCKCGRYGKDIDHSGRRAYERVMIANERWDEMINHKDLFYNSWDSC